MDHQQMALIHIFSWSAAIILFVIAYVMIKQNKQEKPIKILQMTLRLFYVLVIATGADLFFRFYFGVQSEYFAESIIKLIAGVWVIAAMEMTLAKAKKGKREFAGWLQLAFALTIALALGFGRLPFGFLP
ncbi:YisL family protein [Alkalibacillus haloalkaliphilus]|uniref:YisL family protein n=1 Tax=Alkalibacillus haloalkaliphilus TaxID=94136 RepID=UPI0003152AE3|nr:YisL family protein [Alkalibacillus haloalkaliphilus]